MGGCRRERHARYEEGGSSNSYIPQGGNGIAVVVTGGAIASG